MQLRNRKNNAVLFQKPSLRQRANKIIEAVPEDLQVFVTQMIEELDKKAISEDKKCEYANNIASFCRHQANMIRRLKDQPALLKNLHDAYASPEKKVTYQRPAFLPQLIKTVGLGVLGQVSPVGAAVASVGYQVYSGVPAGGRDYCGANIMYCKQGYLTDAQSNFVASFSSTLYPGGAENNNDLALLTCLDVNKVGNTVGLFLTATNGTQMCTVNSVPYYLSTVAVTATNLPDHSCQAFQEAFVPVFQTCMNDASSMGVIIGGVAAGVGAVAICAMVACYMTNAGSCLLKKCC